MKLTEEQFTTILEDMIMNGLILDHGDGTYTVSIEAQIQIEKFHNDKKGVRQ